MRTRILASVLAAALLTVSASAVLACDKSKASAKAASAENKSHCTYDKNATAEVATQKGDARVMAVPAGASCSAGKVSKSGSMAARTGCDVCDEYAGCNEKLTIAGAVTQVVPLKNGVMFVYTTDSPKNVHAIQSAVTQRNDRIAQLASSGKESTLCPGCSSMRDAMASGKMNREVVNIEGGSLTLVTSEDPSVIKAIQEASGVPSTVAKS